MKAHSLQNQAHLDLGHHNLMVSWSNELRDMYFHYYIRVILILGHRHPNGGQQ